MTVGRRQLRALQVEVTSRCTRCCALCPRDALGDRWRDGDLPDDVWSRLEPDLSLASHVHLQGWGEPLLHPGLRRMARAAKRAGCTVGITTNGDLLEQAGGWIAAERIDVVTLSVAGEPATHGRLRGGSDLERVLAAAETLARLLHRGARLQLSYLATRENIDELPALVERAARRGVKEVFVSHLDCTPTAELRDLALFSAAGLSPGATQALAATTELARRRRLLLRLPHPLEGPRDLLTCALDPTRLAFVGFDGRVGPCVNLLLPIRGAIPRAGLRGALAVEPVSYGVLPASSLQELLAGEARLRFIAPFVRRLEAERRFVDSLPTGLGAEALRELELADRQRDGALAASPFPAACDGCHKAGGW